MVLESVGVNYLYSIYVSASYQVSILPLTNVLYNTRPFSEAYLRLVAIAGSMISPVVNVISLG